MILQEIYEELQIIETHLRKKTLNLLPGEMKSPFKPKGYEFADIRELRDGEPVRHIAKRQSLIAHPEKIFTIERKELKQKPVYIALDISESMHITENKLRLTLVTAGSLGLGCTKNQNPVGLVTFADEPKIAAYPRNGRRHIYHMVKELFTMLSDTQNQTRTTDFGAAFDFLSRNLPGKSGIIIISDFIGFSAKEHRESIIALSALHETVCIALLETSEFETKWWQRFATIKLIEAETGKEIHIPVREFPKIKKETETHYVELTEDLRRIGVEAESIPYENRIEALITFMNKRR